MCNFGFQPEALNRAFLDIFEELLVLQNFFSCKITPRHCKNRFCKSIGSPLWMLKKNVFKSSFYQSHVVAFGFAKMVFAVPGGNFAWKKILQNRSSSNISKNALLSASGWNPKLHNYHTPRFHVLRKGFHGSQKCTIWQVLLMTQCLNI